MTEERLKSEVSDLKKELIKNKVIYGYAFANYMTYTISEINRDSYQAMKNGSIVYRSQSMDDIAEYVVKKAFETIKM